MVAAVEIIESRNAYKHRDNEQRPLSHSLPPFGLPEEQSPQGTERDLKAHRRRATKCLMDSGEIVVHKVNGNHIRVIIQFL